MRLLPMHKLPENLREARSVCPQEYAGTVMRVVPCDRCPTGWNAKTKRCHVAMGIEHFPLVSSEKVPNCPLQHVCQHQTQLVGKPCAVRARGFICESALALAGVKHPEDHPLGFNADVMATPEELAAEDR